MSGDDLLLGLIAYAVFVFSVTFHEFAHAWAALRGGDATAYAGGQVSLDPVPHMQREPWGMVVIPIVSFIYAGWPMGWASAPYDPAWARRYPRRAGWMALAGPASNALLFLVAAAAIHIGIEAEIFFAPQRINATAVIGGSGGGMNATLATLVSIFFSLNLLLCVLNLIPVPPLDGAGVLALFVSEERALRLQDTLDNPQFAMLGLLGAMFLVYSMFGKIFVTAVNLVHPMLNYG